MTVAVGVGDAVSNDNPGRTSAERTVDGNDVDAPAGEDDESAGMATHMAMVRAAPNVADSHRPDR
jgi:hypothetical protein